jgi:hypothetical protein
MNPTRAMGIASFPLTVHFGERKPPRVDQTT